MQSKSHELLWALIAIAFITMMYLFMQVVLRGVPAAGSLYGHSMGIVGFVMMLMTETLYSLRKRSHNARWGKMSTWLEFHIFTGLVGPYLVLLHTAWKFQGLAGIVMLLTIVVVASGFVGRYIYTSIPRKPTGEELSLEDLEQLVRQTESNLARLQRGGSNLPPGVAPVRLPVEMENASPASGGMSLVLGRMWIELRETLDSWQVGQGLDRAGRERAIALAQLRRRKNRLQRQMASLAAARNLLSVWQALHIPFGLTLFLMAFLHIFAAIYYASMMR
jgi:hypothetical protein